MSMWNGQQNLSRRSLLLGASMAMGYLLTGCSSSTSTLELLLLRGSIPSQLVGQFRGVFKQQSAQDINLTVRSGQQLQELFSLLQMWKQSPPQPSSQSFWTDLLKWIPFTGDRDQNGVPDLMTLGDYWLGKAVEQGLLTPLDVRSLKGWQQVAQFPQLQQLVSRDRIGRPDSKGQVWAVPYRMGTTVIAYRRDIFAGRKLAPPTDWGDLWRPDLRRRISLLNQARDVIGLTLKKLGQSYNTADLSAVANLQQELDALQQQALFYSSDAYLQPLLLEDTWVTVGWSNDLLPLSQRSPQIAVVVPKSGTALWVDLWVCPAGKSALSPIASQWIDFCWQRETAAQLASATWAAPPTLIGAAIDQLPERFRDYPALLPDLQTLQASEFLLPLSSKTLEQYRSLWKQVRGR